MKEGDQIVHFFCSLDHPIGMRVSHTLLFQILQDMPIGRICIHTCVSTKLYAYEEQLVIIHFDGGYNRLANKHCFTVYF